MHDSSSRSYVGLSRTVFPSCLKAQGAAFMSSLFNAGVYAAASVTTVFIVLVWRISAWTLCGLHAYLLPEDSSNGNTRTPSEVRKDGEGQDVGLNAGNDKKPVKHSKKKKDKDKFVWNEGGSEILRVTIGDSYLENTRYFQDYDQAVLYSALGLSVLIANEYLHLHFGCNVDKAAANKSLFGNDGFIPLIVTVFSILKLIHILCKVSWDRYSSKNSEWALSCAVGFVGLMVASIIIFSVPSDVIDLGIDQAVNDSGLKQLTYIGPFTIRLLVASGAAWLTGLFLGPVLKCVRCFWLGTNQLGWDLSVVKAGTWISFLLNLSMVLPLVTAFLWLKPMAELFIREPKIERGTGWLFGQSDTTFGGIHWGDSMYQGEDWARNLGFSEGALEDLKFMGLLLTGLIQLLLLRTNVQSYLNLGVLVWYESLHGTRTPDAHALKTKILVVNHFMCRVAVQNLVPAMLVILFAGLSRTWTCSFNDDTAKGALLFAPGFVRQVALFFSWWTVLAWALLTCTVLSLFRLGLLLAY